MKIRLENFNQGKRTFQLQLEEGDPVVKTMEAFASKYLLSKSSFSGKGTLENIVLIFSKDQKQVTIDEICEVLKFDGSIDIDKGVPEINVKVIVGINNGDVKGGELVEALTYSAMDLTIEETE